MPTLDISDDHADRIEALREELEAAHAGPYASVDREDALAYLLDLADAVDDPDRAAEPATSAEEPVSGGSDAEAPVAPFDRDRARELLSARNRRRGDPDPDDPMDLSAVAAEFDVTGRSGMTKDELVDAILDAAERLATDPFARVDVDLDAADGSGENGESGEADGARDEAGATEGDEGETGDSEDGDGTEGTASDADETETGADAGGAGQLDAMMSLLDTHGDKWREADGDARYEVDLPDGSVETARTKDDVRALLFRNY